MLAEAAGKPQQFGCRLGAGLFWKHWCRRRCWVFASGVCLCERYSCEIIVRLPSVVERVRERDGVVVEWW
jgi:hypothetical protein